MAAMKTGVDIMLKDIQTRYKKILKVHIFNKKSSKNAQCDIPITKTYLKLCQ